MDTEPPARPVIALATGFAALAVPSVLTRQPLVVAAAVGVGAWWAVAVGRRRSVRAAATARLLEEGLVGSGRVLSACATGGFGRSQVLELKLDVSLGRRPPYVVIPRAAVPAHRAKRVEAGATVRVRVDPDDARNVVVDLAPE